MVLVVALQSESFISKFEFEYACTASTHFGLLLPLFFFLLLLREQHLHGSSQDFSSSFFCCFSSSFSVVDRVVLLLLLLRLLLRSERSRKSETGSSNAFFKWSDHFVPNLVTEHAVVEERRK
jgi:hypothetical protein